MNIRVPVYIQPVSEKTQFLPTHFNSKEYDTLASLNLPMNESGTILPQACEKIPLGYRIILPRGCVGMIKERKSIVEETPFHVLSGMLDCNTLTESTDLKREIEEPKSESVINSNSVTICRKHPEVVLYVHNCGVKPLEYKRGTSIVQLFLIPVYESQIQLLQFSSFDLITPPLRYKI